MLFVPAGANTFGAIQANASGRPVAAQGTSVTPAVGSKGSWAQAIASLDSDTYGLMICINSNNTASASRNTMVDIGIGGSGSEVALIGNLLGGNAIPYNLAGNGLWYFFPVALPAGTRIAVRAQGTVTTAFSVYIQAFQKPLNPSMIKKAAFVETLGAGTLPQGTSVTSGTNSEGAWVSLGTTTERLWFWQIGAQVTSADTTHGTVAYHLDLAVGNGTNFNLIIQDALMTTNTNEQASLPPFTVGCEYPVPAGSTIYARAQASATPDPLFITAYGAGG